jgi:ribose transport system substrate-binding protein
MVLSRRYLVVPLLLAALATALTACGSDDKTTDNGSGGQQTLLWIQPLKGHPVHKIMQGGFLSRCKELKYKCEIVGSEQVDIPATNALADARLARGDIKGVADYAFDPATYPYIAQLAAKNLPVVAWHTPVAEGDAPGLKATAHCDPVVYAKEVADKLGEAISGTGTVALTQGSFNTTENLVSKTFIDEMKAKFPNVKVLPAQEEGFDAPAAISKAVAIMQANPDLVGAFSTTGGGPATWAGAQKQTGKKIKAIGMDYTRQNLDLVKSGDIYAVVGQPLFEEGAKMVDLLDALIKKQTVSYENPLPAEFITAGKVDQYYALLDKADSAQ